MEAGRELAFAAAAEAEDAGIIPFLIDFEVSAPGDGVTVFNRQRAILADIFDVVGVFAVAVRAADFAVFDPGHNPAAGVFLRELDCERTAGADDLLDLGMADGKAPGTCRGKAEELVCALRGMERASASQLGQGNCVCLWHSTSFGLKPAGWQEKRSHQYKGFRPAHSPSRTSPHQTRGLLPSSIVRILSVSRMPGVRGPHERVLADLSR